MNFSQFTLFLFDSLCSKKSIGGVFKIIANVYQCSKKLRKAGRFDVFEILSVLVKSV